MPQNCVDVTHQHFLHSPFSEGLYGDGLAAGGSGCSSDSDTGTNLWLWLGITIGSLVALCCCVCTATVLVPSCSGLYSCSFVGLYVIAFLHGRPLPLQALLVARSLSQSTGKKDVCSADLDHTPGSLVVCNTYCTKYHYCIIHDVISCYTIPYYAPVSLCHKHGCAIFLPLDFANDFPVFSAMLTPPHHHRHVNAGCS